MLARPRYLSVLLPALCAAAMAYLIVNLEPTLRRLHVSTSPDALVLAGRIVGTSFGLAIAWLCCKLVDVFLWQSMVERRTGQAAPRLLVASVRVVIVVTIACLIVANVYDQPLTGLLVSSGMIGIVLGLALQRTIGDFFSGIALNADRSFRLGDWIDVDGTVGKVVEINWRSAHLVRLDQVTVILPNSYIAERRMLNYNLPKSVFRDQVPIALEYGVPIPDARRVLLAGIRAAEGVLDQPAPDVLAWEFGNDGILYMMRYYVDSYANMAQIHDHVVTSVNHHLYQAGLSVPFPKRDVFHAPMPPREIDRRKDRAALVGRIDLFHGLDPDELAQVTAGLTEQRFTAGDRIVHQGEGGSALFVVVDGLLDVRVEGSGTWTKVAQLQPGQFFGEMSLLTGEPRSATIIAVTDSTLYALDRQVLAPILQNRPSLAETLSKVLAERKLQTQSRLDRADAPKRSEPDRNLASDLLHRIQTFFRLND